MHERRHCSGICNVWTKQWTTLRVVVYSRYGQEFLDQGLHKEEPSRRRALWGESNPWMEQLYLLDQVYVVKLRWREAETIHWHINCSGRFVILIRASLLSSRGVRNLNSWYHVNPIPVVWCQESWSIKSELLANFCAWSMRRDLYACA